MRFWCRSRSFCGFCIVILGFWLASGEWKYGSEESNGSCRNVDNNNKKRSEISNLLYAENSACCHLANQTMLSSSGN